MSPAFTTRRRADEFDRLVEAAFAGDLVPADGSELRELADLASGLQSVAVAPEPRPAFSAALRERLMTAAATELVAPDPAVARRLTVRGPADSKQRRQRRLTVGVAALAVIGATAGTALASQGALPGDTLYPVKRAIENIQAGFSVDDQAKGTTLLSDAGARLDEIGQLSQRHEPTDVDEIESTLSTFADQARHASDLLISDYESSHDPDAITHLRDFTAQSIQQLTRLEADIPSGARDALSQAAQTLLGIDQTAQSLCPSCGSAGVLRVPASLLDAVGNVLGQTSGKTDGQSGTQGSTGTQGGSTGEQGGSPSSSSQSPSTVVPPLLPTSIVPPLTQSKKSASPGAGRSTAGPPKKHATKSSSTSTQPGLPDAGLGGVVGDVTGGVGGAVGGLLGN